MAAVNTRNEPGETIHEPDDAIHVNVRCFGSLAERVGETCVVTVSAPARVVDIIHHLNAHELHLALLLLNGRQVTASEPVRDGDQLMLIPPVQGG